MSTRWYPIYQKGNPQLRVFLPNFWMKLLRPQDKQPANVVQFGCSMEMTKYDVRNYLEKIYKIDNIIDVRTRIDMGKTKRDPGKGYIVKEDDMKIAYVILPQSVKFEFPNLFPKDEEEAIQEEMKSLEIAKNEHKAFLKKNEKRPGIPGWFSI